MTAQFARKSDFGLLQVGQPDIGHGIRRCVQQKRGNMARRRGPTNYCLQYQQTPTAKQGPGPPKWLGGPVLWQYMSPKYPPCTRATAREELPLSPAGKVEEGREPTAKARTATQKYVRVRLYTSAYVVCAHVKTGEKYQRNKKHLTNFMLPKYEYMGNINPALVGAFTVGDEERESGNTQSRPLFRAETLSFTLDSIAK